MTIENTASYSGPYNANGVTTVFPFEFYAVSADEITVLVDSDVASPSSYTVNRAPDGSGDVTFLTAPAAGSVVLIAGAPSFAQTFDYQRFGPFYPDRINPALDAGAARDIYLLGEVGRALVAPVGETGGTLPPLATRGGKLALFDFEGGITAIDTLGVGNPDVVDYGEWSEDGDIVDLGEWG